MHSLSAETPASPRMTRKGKPFHHRLKFALAGLAVAVRAEASFRTHVLAAALALLALAGLRPGWLWAAVMAIAIALVLALELVNTALEHALDGLHPELAEFVGIAKDCAAAGVLLASILAVVLFCFMLMDLFL